MFSEPTFEPPKAELPADLAAIVDESVARFKQQLGIFQNQEWIDNYKIEVTSVARQAFEAGKK